MCRSGLTEGAYHELVAFNPRIMVKFSDVLGDGIRSPSNYLEQLQRCASDGGVDIFATINNQIILGAAGDSAQSKMESQLLNDSIRKRVERLRSRELRGQDVVVFTRAGALLNLKLLLGLDRPLSTCRLTAIGASALHANDYVESPDPHRLSSGLLPVAAEFGSSWETNNHRTVGPLLHRCSLLSKIALVISPDSNSIRLYPVVRISESPVFNNLRDAIHGILAVFGSSD